MKIVSRRPKNKKRSKTLRLRYGRSLTSMAKYKKYKTKSPSRSYRGGEGYSDRCYFFAGNPTPTIQDIKGRFRCTRNAKTKTMRLYTQDQVNKEQYNYISPEHLNSCITEYNKSFREGKDAMTLDSLCDANTGFKDINPDYDDLISYAYELESKFEVDALIKEFIMNLILYTNINRDGLNEIYKGAFVIIQDKGFFYDSIVTQKNLSKLRICNKKKRIPDTSHDSVYNAPQYRIGNGILYACSEGACDKTKANSSFDCLIGKSPIPDLYGNTWFQFEYANLVGVWNKYLLHAISFVQHKITGKNIGPLGNSEYAEYVKPLILTTCSCVGNLVANCVLLQCVKPKIDIHEYSSKFLSTVRLSLEDYTHVRLKSFVTSGFYEDYKISFSQLYDAIRDHKFHATSSDESSSGDRSHLAQVEMIEPYVVMLMEHMDMEQKNILYDIDIIQEIVFLLFYCATNNITENDTISMIRSKYPFIFDV